MGAENFIIIWRSLQYYAYLVHVHIFASLRVVERGVKSRLTDSPMRSPRELTPKEKLVVAYNNWSARVGEDAKELDRKVRVACSHYRKLGAVKWQELTAWSQHAWQQHLGHYTTVCRAEGRFYLHT